MTLASDQNLDTGRLSATAQRMLALRDVVLAEWEKRLRSTVNEAAALPHPILINTFPTLYDNIAHDWKRTFHSIFGSAYERSMRRQHQRSG